MAFAVDCSTTVTLLTIDRAVAVGCFETADAEDLDAGVAPYAEGCLMGVDAELDLAEDFEAGVSPYAEGRLTEVDVEVDLVVDFEVGHPPYAGGF